MWHISHVFSEGNQIRVEIESSSFPRWDRNLGGENQKSKISPFKQTIHHSSQYPSRVILPKIPNSK